MLKVLPLQSNNAVTSDNNNNNNNTANDDKKLTLTQKMKLVFPELASMTKIPMSVKSHYLGTRAQVKSGERELTWTGLTLWELEAMTTRLRERGRLQYQRIKDSGGSPFCASGSLPVKKEKQAKKESKKEAKKTEKKEESKSKKRKEVPVKLVPYPIDSVKRIRPTPVPEVRQTASETDSSSEDDGESVDNTEDNESE